MKQAEARTNAASEIHANYLSERICGFVNFRFTIRLLSILLIIPAVLSDVRAQISVDDDAPIKVDTVLFTIPLSVSDSKGRNIPGLKKQDFTIYQDGEKQDIEYFLNEEAPMNVAILLDTSYSTKEVLDEIQDAARDFIKLLRPEDKAVIVSFDYRTIFLSGLTSDRKILSNAIKQARVTEASGSDMPEAIRLVLNNHFASLKGRKAIIALTDGMVAGRNNTAQQLLDSMQESDTLFYPIIFKTNFYSNRKSSARPSKLINILEILADETAGRFYEKDATRLKEAFRSIAEELKKQYLIGFYPQYTRNGKSTGHIRVEVDHKNLIVRAKKRLKFDN